MITGDEIRAVAAVLRALGMREVFIPRDILAEAFGGYLYVEEDMRRDGWTLRLEER